MIKRTRFLSPYDGVTEVEIQDVGIKALPCFGTNSIGFKIITKDGIICYSSDTSFTENLADYYKGCDFLILNMPWIEPVDNLLDKDAVIKIIESVQPKLAIITGFGMKMLAEDILNEIRLIKKATSINVIAAKDDLSIELSDYR